MSIRLKSGVAALVVALASCSFGQQRPTTKPSSAGQAANKNYPRTLNSDDGLAVISAALDSRVRPFFGGDCSHLVHAIYERAGFSYPYETSYELYDGAGKFQRVWYPQPGDLVVWRGHVGIVVRPSRHVFYSFLRAGPTTDDYRSPYWISRGTPRFYRYVKNAPCAGCTSAAARVPRIREGK